MGINCKIHYNIEGGVEYVENPKGERSELFDSLRTLFGENKALDLYALTESEDFKTIQAGKVKSKANTIEYNGTKVYFEERISPQGKVLGGWELKLIESENRGKGNARKAMEKFLTLADQNKQSVYLTVAPRDKTTTEKGLIDFYKSVGFSLEPSGFEMVRRPKKVSEEPTVKDVLLYANTTQEALSKEQVESAIEMGMSNNSELALMLEQAFMEDGMIVFKKSKLREAGYNEYEITAILATPSLQDSIKENLFKVVNSDFTVDYNGEELSYSDELTIFGKQKVYVEVKQEGVNEVVNGEIRAKKSDTLQTLRKTYPLNPKPISDRLNVMLTAISTLKKSVADRNIQDVKNTVRGIQKEMVDYGVDLRGIENKIFPLQRLQSFLNSLEQYITNPNDSFSEKYDEFFDISLEEPQDLGDDVKIDSELSEYELFRDFNLVRKEGNIYTKVSPENIEDLYNYFFRQQTELTTKEEVQAKATELEAEDYEIDSDVLEALYIWKKFLNYPIKTISNNKPDFVNLAYAVNNPYTKATSKGIGLTSNDPITKAKADLYAEVVEEVRDYNTEDTLRGKIFRGEVSVPKITTDYSIVEDGVLITKNNLNQFVKTPYGNYELIYREANISFYKEIESEKKTFSDIQFSKYLGEATIPEKYVEAKKSYTKKELEEIKNKHFNCQ